MLRRLAFASAALLVALASAPVRATTVEAYDLAGLKRSAVRVALVRAGEPVGRRDARGRIVTDVPLLVEDGIVGGTAPFVLTVFGGRLGDVGMVTVGEPRLDAGRRYVVFARAWNDAGTPRFRPVGMSQGVLPVDGDAGGAEVRPGGGGLTLVPSGARPAVASPEPLETFLVRLRQLPSAAVPAASGDVAP